MRTRSGNDRAPIFSITWRLCTFAVTSERPSSPAIGLLIRPPMAQANTSRSRSVRVAYMAYPKDLRTKLHSANPLQRLNGEIKRRTNVVGIFPGEGAIVRLVGALLLEQHDE